MWLGYNSSDKDWICLSSQNPELEVTASMSIVPYVLPGPMQGESFGFPGYTIRSFASQLTTTEGHYFPERFSMGNWFNVPESDLGKMCIEFKLGADVSQTRWKR